MNFVLENNGTNPGFQRYVLYDVNPGEGFNLRRDVYMRIASLVKRLREHKLRYDWVLVLPPWGPLYHWNSPELEDTQARIPWKKFFDHNSLNQYLPVVELDAFLRGKKINEFTHRLA